MRKLHLVGLTTDRDGLIFTARKGAKSGGFIVPIDDRVLSAIADAGRLDNGVPVEEDPAIPGVEVVPKRLRSESALTPREMQARLRAGRSIDEVAAEAGVDTEWVARFAVPILAEQAQVVELARALVYAKPRLGESSQPLGASVVQNLSDRGVFLPDDVANAGWSAFQLHDSVWMVRFRYRARGRDQEAQWEIDVPTGHLRARNRHASDLGYVDPGRARSAIDSEAVPDEEDATLVPPPPSKSRATKRVIASASAAAAPAAKLPKASSRPGTKARKVAKTSRVAPVTKTTRATKAAKVPPPAKAARGAKATKAGGAPQRTRMGATAKAGRSTKVAGTPAPAKAAPVGAKRSPRKASAKPAPADAKGSPSAASAKGSGRRRPAKAGPASDTGPTAGSGAARMAAAQVSTARMAASMATVDREPWAAAIRRPSRPDARPASPGARGADGQLRPAAPDAQRPSRRGGGTGQVRAFQPRPLPPPGQEPARPRVRKVTVPRPTSTGDGPAPVSLPARRGPLPAQEPMPVDRSKRRRLRSR